MKAWVAQIIRAMDNGFPPHRITPLWVATLFTVPAIIYATVPLEPIFLAITAMVWVLLSLSLAVVGVLDWARQTPRTERPLLALLRAGARLGIAALGLLPILFSVVLGVRVVAVRDMGSRVWFPLVILSLSMSGLGLMRLPYSRPRQGRGWAHPERGV